MARTAKKPANIYGEGSVYQECTEAAGCPPLNEERERPEHRCTGRWVGAFFHGYTDQGKPRRFRVTGDTASQARTRMRKRMGEVRDGGGAAASSKTTVKQWSEEWLGIAERTQRPQPFTNTRSAVRKWIVPTIGHKRLGDLTPADVRKVGNAQRAAGLKPSSQRRTHSTLMTMLKAARADGYAVPAIVVEVAAPAANPTDRQDLPVDLAVEMLGVASGIPQGSRWVAAFLQGLRQGEALGTRWSDIDFERDLMQVSWQLQPLPYRVAYDRTSGFRVPDNYEAIQLDGRWHLVRPKTAAGLRVIPLVPWFKSALLAWREVAPKSEHDLVWPALDGSPCDPKVDDAEWYLLQETVATSRGTSALHPSGRLWTIHEARHTTATLLMEAGVPLAVIIAIVGHSSMLSTKSYLHVNAAPLAEAMGKVAERLALAA